MTLLPLHMFLKAEPFSHILANNCIWDNSGLVPPFDNFIPLVKILRIDVFHALAGLNSRKAYGPDGTPPIVLKNCASVFAPYMAKFFQLSVNIDLTFLLEVCLHSDCP